MFCFAFRFVFDVAFLPFCACALLHVYSSWVGSFRSLLKCIICPTFLHLGNRGSLLQAQPFLGQLQFQHCGEVALVCYALSRMKLPLIAEEHILYLASPMLELEILENNSKLFASCARQVREQLKDLKMP